MSRQDRLQTDRPAAEADLEALKEAIQQHDEYLLAAGPAAREVFSDLAELHRYRREKAGWLFKRKKSPYWQLKYRDGKGRCTPGLDGARGVVYQTLKSLSQWISCTPSLM